MTQIVGHARAQAFGQLYVTAEAWVQSQARPCQICDAQLGTTIGFSRSNLVFHCHCHSTCTPCSLIHISHCIILAFMVLLNNMLKNEIDFFNM
jgi:hypothetical protein